MRNLSTKIDKSVLRYPCVERMKFKYIYFAVILIPLLICVKEFLERGVVTGIKTAITMGCVYTVICALIYFVQLFNDLSFIKRLSFAVSKNLLSKEKAWEMIYSGRGMRLLDSILVDPRIGRFLAKIFFEHALESKDKNLEEFAKKYASFLNNHEKSNESLDITDTTLKVIAESTWESLSSSGNDFILFKLLDTPIMRIFYYWIFILVFGGFLLLQLMKIFGLLKH